MHRTVASLAAMPLVLTLSPLHGLGHLVELDGSLDSKTSAQLDAELQRLANSRAKVVVLDLAKLSSISSAGVRVIGKGIGALGPHGGILKLFKPQPQVVTALEDSKDLPLSVQQLIASDAELDAFLGGLQDTDSA